MTHSAQLGGSPLGAFQLGAIGHSPAPIPPIVTPASRTFTVGNNCNHSAYVTPAEVIDYAINWLPYLEPGEIILTSSWISTGIIITTPPPFIQASNTATTVWLSGGIAGTTCIVTNSITTDEGRVFQESFTVYVNIYNYV